MLEIETLAHEIINPLNIIVGCAELSKLENKTDNKQISQYLELILNQSRECCSILRDQISTHKSKKKIPQFSPTDVHYLIRENIKKHRQNPIAKTNNIKIELNSFIKSPNFLPSFKLNLNLTYLKIIINNLLLNSVKYSKSNTKIIINLKPTHIGDNVLCIEIINEIISEISNKNNIKNKDTNEFSKSNYIGLTLVDNLIKAINGDWEIIQNEGEIHTLVYI
jgi:signal transduction histidine kinase